MLWNMKRILLQIIFLCLVVWVPLAVSMQSAFASIETEQLIVFVQPQRSVVDDVFQERQLPLIRKVAAAMGVPVHLVDASKGVPAEVLLTPLIIYQNHRGRSVYQGRTTTPERVRNFIRTSRFIPQGNTPNHRTNIPVWEKGHTRLWAPLKVAAVTGSPPPGYDHDRFVKEALVHINNGFKHFRTELSADLGRADRGFYMDFYPWLAEDGTLFLSLALYSQFHCKEPVFELKKQPLTGPWRRRHELFQRAGRILEAEVVKRIKDPDGGDGFDAIAQNVVATTWEQLGFPRPKASARESVKVLGNAKLSQDWVLATPGLDDPPMIQFRFPAPLDSYAGEARTGLGEFHLTPDLLMDNAQGFVQINTDSAITMGDPVLDDAIKGSIMLNTKKYPTAKFVIQQVRSDGRPLVYGSLKPAGISGEFTLKGKTQPLSLAAEAEPVLDALGRPTLLVRGRFQIDLQAFDIEGAEGPAPARHTLVFDINLAFRSKR